MSARRNDLGIYDRHGAAWWDERDRAFASLRNINRFRLRILERWLGPSLRGAWIADLGCGGGLMAVPLAERGARVVGVDCSQSSLRTGARQAPPRRCLFVRGDAAEPPLATESADVVLLADVLEHVEDPARVIGEAARLLRPGGHLFVNTINRTVRARLMAVWLGESFGLIPRGTHDHGMFRRPAELDLWTSRVGLRRRHLQGEGVAVMRTVRRWAIELQESPSVAVGYSALYAKEPTR